jgi:D-glycero-beta-D-manno-heptose 1-phosphate adenylyltransferase
MSQLEIIESKIIYGIELSRLLAIWRFKGKKIVFTNGCFDILHKGHIDYLAKASDYGDVLVIGLNTDHSIKKIKGAKRPVQDENSRALIMASLNFVTAVILFDEETPYELIKQVKPDVLIKGADYTPEEIVGYDIVKAKKGKIVTLDYIQGYSTTGIIEKIKSL